MQTVNFLPSYPTHLPNPHLKISKFIMKATTLILMSCLAFLGGSQACDTLAPPAENWDMDLMWGTWYEQVWYFRSEAEMQLPYPCVYHELKQGFPIADYENYEDLGVPKVTNWEMGSFETPSGWRSRNLEHPYTNPVYGVTNVATDFETYTVQWQCWADSLASGSGRTWERVTIWTRERNPTEALLAELEPIVESLGYPLTNVTRVDHSNCQK